jgi:hypothetical protein
MMNLWTAAGIACVVAGTFYLAYCHDRRVAAAQVRAELLTQFREHPQSALIRLREPYMTQLGELEREEQAAGAASTAAEGKRAKWSAQIWRGQEPKLGFMIIVGVLSVVWGFLFLLQRAMDITVMQALKSVDPQLFGNVIALVFVVIGILLSGIAGMHNLLPSWLEPKRALTRVAVVGVLLLGATLMMMKVADLAQYRSIDKFTQAVNSDTATLKQLQAQKVTRAQQVQVASAQQTLQQDERRLDNAKGMDRMLTMAVLPAELALSGFPVFAAELATVGSLGWTARRHRRRQDRAAGRRAALPQEFREQAATLLAEANPDMTLAQIDALIASLEGGPAPEEPVGPGAQPSSDGPGSEPPPDDGASGGGRRPGGLGGYRPPDDEDPQHPWIAA